MYSFGWFENALRKDDRSARNFAHTAKMYISEVSTSYYESISHFLQVNHVYVKPQGSERLLGIVAKFQGAYLLWFYAYTRSECVDISIEGAVQIRSACF